MSLSTSLDVARSSLSVTAEQTALVSRNIGAVGIANASRKAANLVTGLSGGARLGSIARAANEALSASMLTAASEAAGQKVIVDALTQLDQTNGDQQLNASPAVLIGKLSNALQLYSAAPADAASARAALTAAGNLTRALNTATKNVQELRNRADADMQASVGRINALLGQFATTNTTIVRGNEASADVTDALDSRDQILKSLSDELGIRTLTRGNGDMSLYTDSGVTLFETKARAVAFERTTSLAAGTAGNAVMIDGVPVTGDAATMAIGSGRLMGLAQVRDDMAVTYQRQLDETARGLIETFAERDQSAVPTLPDQPGLFTFAGATGVPLAGTAVDGLAGAIAINATADPARGGDASRLRDGGISNPASPAYIYNTAGGSQNGVRLLALIDGLAQQRAFDRAAGIEPSANVSSYASSSVAWLQEMRKSASTLADTKSAFLQRASDALSKETGVNLDDEMTKMLGLERSYQASSRLISTIDSMFNSLLNAV